MRRTSRTPCWLLALLLLNLATIASAQAPYRAYSVLLGGSLFEAGAQIAVDDSGQTWLVGDTQSRDFPFTTAPGGNIFDFFHDIFIARLSPAGELLSAISFGGNSNDYITALRLDPAGNLYLAGSTASRDFPVTTRLGPSANTGSDYVLEAFVLKFDPQGRLVYSTHFGGTPYRTINGLAVDAQGQAHVVADAPVPVPAGPLDRDIFFAKLSADGSRLLYSRQMGGSSYDMAQGIALDAAGNAHVVGFTNSSDFPEVRPLPENGAAGLPDALVLKISPDGSRLIHATLLGGDGSDMARAVAIDPAGNALVYGETSSTDFPVRNPLQSQLTPSPEDWPSDAYLTRLDPAGALLGSTYLGGSGAELATAITVDRAGFISLLGHTTSTDFPLRDPFPAEEVPFPYYHMGHLTRLNPQASEILFSTLLEGTREDSGWNHGITVDARGDVYLAGGTFSPLFPVIGPSQSTQVEEDGDAFAVKIDLNRSPDCTRAVASPALLGPPYGWFRTVTVQGVSDPDGEPVSAIVTRITQDELLSQFGQPDAKGIGTARPQVRADRLSSGDGRVYHLTFTASDPAGAACTGRVTVCVPVDPSRPICRDGGARFVSSGA